MSKNVFLGGFQLIQTGPNTLQVDPASSIFVSSQIYTPLGSTEPIDRLSISSRIYMTANQIEAESLSVSYAQENIESPPNERLLEISTSTSPTPTVTTAPYEAFYIKGLGYNFVPNWNDDINLRDYIYLELDIWPTLDIRSAQIVVGPIGGNGNGFIPGESSDGNRLERIDYLDGEVDFLGWTNYPSKEFIYPDNGQDRFQKKYRVLIGYLTNSFSNNKDGYYFENSQGVSFKVVSSSNYDFQVAHFLNNEIPIVKLLPSENENQIISQYELGT